MRQLEADRAKELNSAKGLLRPKAAYEAATMLVDASQHAWKVLYINSQATEVTGGALHCAHSTGAAGIGLWTLCASLAATCCRLHYDEYLFHLGLKIPAVGTLCSVA